jgi:ribonuclease HII
MIIHDELILGIDEAGRGPVIGPMVMACVALRPRKAAALTRAGVTDSKRFPTHEQRLALVPKILDCADHTAVVVVDVEEIDRRCRHGELNRLEQEHAERMIRRAPACRRIVCDGERLFSPLCARWPQLEARDQAELHHAAVAAASILAKVRRDQLWFKIYRRYEVEFGELAARGGGYTNEATRAFLRAYIRKYRRLPPEARRSWPWGFASDLLGRRFDPFCDVVDDRPQLSLFSTPDSQETPAPEPPSPCHASAASRAQARRASSRGRSSST